MSRRSAFRGALLALLASLGLAACAHVAPATAPASPGLAGRQWLVQDAEALVAGLPELAEPLPEPPAAPADPSALAEWVEPASAWAERELRAIAAESSTPPRAARNLMLLGTAMNDALAVGAHARAAGLEVSDEALVAEAAARVLTASHPMLADGFRADADLAAWAGYWGGRADVAEVLRGRLLGAAVADAVLAWAAADGADALAPNVALPAAEPGVWQPTPPQHDLPQEPAWGRVRTVAVGDPASLRAPQPPAWDSPEMAAQLQAFRTAQAGLNDEGRAEALYWAAGMGTVTLPGMWLQIARELVLREGLPLREAATIYAALGVALHDAAVACWETKYHYWLARPIQAMEPIDSAWEPLLQTPPHPSYPSDHASFSGAAAAVLGVAFPEDAAELARQAEAASRSQVLGGIHWPIDGQAGLEQGRLVAERVLGRGWAGWPD